VIHLEGMGVLGSFIAWTLHQRGVQFTWHDIDSSVNAWRASTGAVFPTGEVEDIDGMRMWQHWLATPSAQLQASTERASWWYCTKAPAHGAKGKPIADLGALKRHPVDSIHFNAQNFVPATRVRFDSQRVGCAPTGAQLVVSHGFNERLDHYVWGWTRLVQLQCDSRMLVAGRPSIYCREGRFVMAYAYPIAGTSYWYAGSSLIVQKKPHDLDVQKKYDTWLKHFTRLTGGLVKVVGAAQFLTGWRPRGLATDGQWWRRRADGALLLKPHWHNGVRHAPLVVNALFKELGL